MITITLYDSQMEPRAPVSPSTLDYRAIPLVITAADKLRKEILDGKIRNYSIKAGVTHPFEESPISCFSSGCVTYNSATLPEKLLFSTSHYIGQATVEVRDTLGRPHRVQFRIQPRMGGSVRDYLIGLASQVYVPERLTSGGNVGAKSDNHWLLLLMWRCAFEYALRNASVPKAYQQREANLRSFRGRLNVVRHIRENLTDQSRLFCTFRPLVTDTTINRTIRHIYRLVANSDSVCSRYAFNGLAEHDARLASFGVSDRGVTVDDIDRIVYTRMTEPYRRLMMLSKVLMRGLGATDGTAQNDSPAFFVDMAELWERYLMQVMCNRIPEYNFSSPNEVEERLWLFNGKRSIRPDFIVRNRAGRLIAILDAKYKRYATIGHSGADRFAVSRDDLYQMATYLYRFADPLTRTVAVFLSPFSVVGNEVEPLAGAHSLHSIGICNLSLPYLDTKEQGESEDTNNAFTLNHLKAQEFDFADRLRRILQGVDNENAV